MKKIKLFFVLIISLIIGQTAQAQLEVNENFDYTASSLLTDDGWSAHSGTGTNPLTVVTPGLTFTDYPSSGIGNAVLVNNLGGEDDNIQFATQNVDGTTLYTSMLVNVTDNSASKAGDYFFNMGYAVSSSSFTFFCARLFAKITSAGVVNFGISNSSTSTTVVYSPTDYSTNSTYLIILKYKINQAGNDSLDMWVKSSGVPAIEADAGAPDASNYTTLGQDSVNAIALRQGSSSNSVAVVVDGIRVSTVWSETLPVELTSFLAKQVGDKVELIWQTATEKNNLGFEVQRSTDGKNFTKIAFVQGHGTTTKPSFYNYSDNAGSANVYFYRLKQIDLNGTYEYSKTVETNASLPTQFSLEQNYPNPFNPSTTIKFTVAKSGISTLKIYNALGQEVATLFNSQTDAGQVYSVNFNASNLASGIYFYQLKQGSQIQTQKMLLMK